MRNIIAFFMFYFAYQPYQPARAMAVVDESGKVRALSFRDCQQAADEVICRFRNSR